MSLSSSTLGKLRKIVGAKGLLTTQVDLATYSFDGTSNWQALPEAVVFPTTAEQVSQILKLATEQGNRPLHYPNEQNYRD